MAYTGKESWKECVCVCVYIYVYVYITDWFYCAPVTKKTL